MPVCTEEAKGRILNAILANMENVCLHPHKLHMLTTSPDSELLSDCSSLRSRKIVK